MSLRARLALLMVLLTLLPSLPAVWVTRQLVDRSLNLGLSTEVADALEAGVRQARTNLRVERERSAAEVARWVDADDAAGVRAKAARGDLPGHSATLVLPDGSRELLGGEPIDAEDRGPSPPAAGVPTDPPRFLEISHPLPDGSVLHVRSPTTDLWRADAGRLAATLQVVRGLQVERERVERTFWIPFLVIYGVALLAALAAAGWLGRGITTPIERLLTAMRAVAAGSWDTQVPVATPRDLARSDEFTRLAIHFNRMVRTLDAQSRRLIDLETMAGWREMARALAHEVKNPLTPIQLTVEEMRERYSGEDASYRRLLDECSQIVVKEVESLRNVVTRFREFSRPVEPCFGSVEVNELVSEVAALQRDLQVETDLAAHPSDLRADPDRLRQVLMNLARNAQVATREATSPRIRFVTRNAGARIAIIVDDNGPGIPVDQRERVFEPYRSGSAGGLGLGLALVKGIVLAHEGTVEIGESEWGGARFRLELPREPEGEVRHG